jgi:uncharacterized protein YjbI with pentapeptide repeats
MIEIKHKTTGVILSTVDAYTLKHARFFEISLIGADFRNQKLDGASFTMVSLNDADFRESSCIHTSFYSTHLQRADLSGARLWGMDGEGADLRHAILNSAQMYLACLRHAAISDAELREADLKAVYLAYANLHRADLRGANFEQAVFHKTGLKGAQMAGAKLCSTIFADCTTLHKAEGLAEIEHLGPSSLDHQTLRACAPHLPDVFLRGTGYTAEELRLLRVMYPSA